MPVVSTWADIEEHFGGWDGLTQAEQRLINDCKTGNDCSLGGLPPEGDPTHDQEIRADILRYMIVGGCENCRTTDKGVDLSGAYITGELDLTLATAKGITGFGHCRFDRMIEAMQARFDLLALNDCRIAGLNAQGARVSGSVFLRSTKSSGPLRFPGARIGGHLACEGSQLEVSRDYALDAQNANIIGGLVMRPFKTENEDEDRPFRANARVSFDAATIGYIGAEHAQFAARTEGHAFSAFNLVCKGNVILNDAIFDGELQLQGARIEGRLSLRRTYLSNSAGHAFTGQRMRVDQDLVWKNVSHKEGQVSLNGAHVEELSDHPDNWPGENEFVLDGFTYDRIKGKVSIAKERLDWLSNGSHYEDRFYPQPYTQYAKFLRETGHDIEARKILTLREQLIREEGRKRLWNEWSFLATPLVLWLMVWDVVQRLVVGYGHKPFNSLFFLLCFWLIATALAHRAWQAGDFAPNAAPILVSEAWQSVASEQANPAQAWAERDNDGDGNRIGYKAGQDWATFNRYAYAADLVIPIIDLGQTDAWAPSTERGPWGRWLYQTGFFLQIAGWIVTALGAAAITGIIRRD
ncbi:MAG: hypothetical protein AAGG57_12390 [Pseudomonadota bacterium]